MNCKYHDEQEQTYHHDFIYAFQTFLNAEDKNNESQYYGYNHEYTHFHRACKHATKDPSHIFGYGGIKLAGKEFAEIIKHPACNGSVVHHEQETSAVAQPSVEMPFGTGLFELLISFKCACPSCTSYGEFHAHYGDSHKYKEQQIEEHEYGSSVSPCNKGEFPYISDTDSAAGTHQYESESCPEYTSLFVHFIISFS